MARSGHIAALGRLDGVIEATLCGPDGVVLESSSNQPELDAAAASLGKALDGLQASLPEFGAPLGITVDTEQGSLLATRFGRSTLVVATGADANLGAIRLEIRHTLQNLEM